MVSPATLVPVDPLAAQELLHLSQPRPHPLAAASAHLDPVDRMVPQEPQDSPVVVDPVDPLASQENPVAKVELDLQEALDSLAAPEAPDPLDNQETVERQEAKEPQDPLDHVAPLDPRDLLGNPAALETVDRVVVLDPRDLPDQVDLPDARDNLDVLDLRLFLERMPTTAPAHAVLRSESGVDRDREDRNVHFEFAATIFVLLVVHGS